MKADQYAEEVANAVEQVEAGHITLPVLWHRLTLLTIAYKAGLPDEPDLVLRLGQTVVVRKDDGVMEVCNVRSEPWKVGGRWVVSLTGIPGGYDLERVWPLVDEPDQWGGR